MLINFLNACSGKGEGGGGVIQTGNGLDLLEKMASGGGSNKVMRVSLIQEQ